jgi:uncharacterized protein (DUF952 family)
MSLDALRFGVYILASETDWQQALALGYWQTPSLATHGFIHAASHEQVPSVYAKHFSEQLSICLLKLDEASLVDYLHWDAHPETGELFPHIYCAIPLASVERVIAWPAD